VGGYSTPWWDQGICSNAQQINTESNLILDQLHLGKSLTITCKAKFFLAAQSELPEIISTSNP
jgi:hypothetical protein